jgi:hypothetical protein
VYIRIMKKLFIILLFFVAACSPKIKKLVYLQYYDVVEVKNSGGFTGASTGFLIQKNGEIYVTFHLPNKGYNQKFYRLSTADSVNVMFEMLAKSNVMAKPYNKPGNLTYSISTRKDSLSNAVYWADGQDSIQNYIEVYNTLRNFASGRKK